MLKQSKSNKETFLEEYSRHRLAMDKDEYGQFIFMFVQCIEEAFSNGVEHEVNSHYQD